MIDPVVHYLLVCLLALVFVQGGAAKLTARDEFQGVVSSYRLLPPAMVPAFAALLPIAELAAGIGVVLPATRHPGAALARPPAPRAGSAALSPRLRDRDRLRREHGPAAPAR